MLKSLTAAYEPSRRSDHWLKLKRCAPLAVCCVLDGVVCRSAWRSQSKTGTATAPSTALH
jgi:ATP-dependent DNA ligase